MVRFVHALGAALGAALAGLTLAACATQPATTQTAQSGPPADRDCFYTNQVSGFSYIDPHTVKITLGPSRDYLLTTDWNARDLNWDHVIGIRSTSGWICTGNGLGVDIIGGDPRRLFPVSGIVRAPETSPPAPAAQGS